VVPPAHESVLAFDPSYIPKERGATPKDWATFGTAVRGEQNGFGNPCVGWVDVTANTAYTISAEMTPAGGLVVSPS